MLYALSNFLIMIFLMVSEVLRAYFISGGREYEKRQNHPIVRKIEPRRRAAERNVGGIRPQEPLSKPYPFYRRRHFGNPLRPSRIHGHDGGSRGRTRGGNHRQGHEPVRARLSQSRPSHGDTTAAGRPAYRHQRRRRQRQGRRRFYPVQKHHERVLRP